MSEETTEETPATQPEQAVRRPDRYIISQGPDVNLDDEAFFKELLEIANRHAVIITMPIHGELEVAGGNKNIIAFFEEANPLFMRAVSVAMR